MARPKGIKVSQLTPDNVAALKAAQAAGQLPAQLVVTATTATWPLTFNAAGALQTVLDAIEQNQGTTRRALHAVRRKLEKQVRPDSKPVVPTPDPPKARKTKNPVACTAAGHGELADVGPGRAKCLDCGLIVDRITKRQTAPKKQTPRQKVAKLPTHAFTPQKPARPGQGGVTTAQIIPAMPKTGATVEAVYMPVQGRYGTIRHGDSYLVVEMAGTIAASGRVLAVCEREADAQLVVASIVQALATPRREVIE